jgi:hypothetical protein
MFEVSRRSLGRAGMCYSPWERIDHLCKKWRAWRKKNSRKMDTTWQVEASTRGRPPAAGRRLSLSSCTQFFEKKIFLILFFWKFGKWARAFGRMGVQYPHFLKLALTLGSANSSKIHGKRRFHFFPKKIFLNLVYTWTFLTTVGIFVSWKVEFTKNPARFASVMEIFCTPLQCRVDLSMFHSSST